MTTNRTWRKSSERAVDAIIDRKTRAEIRAAWIVLIEKWIKLEDVVLTKVGTSLVKVKVMSVYGGHFGQVRRYFVARIERDGSLKDLPKARTAAALRPLPDKVERAAENKTTRSDGDTKRGQQSHFMKCEVTR